MPRRLAPIAAIVALAALAPIAVVLGDDTSGGRSVQSATALTPTFTYQGRLTDGGSPANGTYDLRFILYDAETGGSQVGSTVTREDVTVAGGLFSVELNFGAAAFQGDARWLEIAVRPGSSTGTFTTLSPRQPVSPAPYALFAVAAGSLKIPLVATGTSAGAPTVRNGLFTVIQEGTGIAISAQRTTTDSAAYPALYGYNAGGGAAVQGESTATGGIGVQAFAVDGTAGRFVGETALELDGALKASNQVAFTHTVAHGTNTCPGGGSITPHSATYFDPTANPALADPDTLVFITVKNIGGSSPASLSLGVTYYGATAPTWCPGITNRWVIYTTDGTAIPNSTTINVLVIAK